MTNATPTFSIKESLIFGWEAFLLHYRIFIPAMFLTLVISFLPEFIGKDYSNGITVIALVLGMIVQIIVGLISDEAYNSITCFQIQQNQMGRLNSPIWGLRRIVGL